MARNRLPQELAQITGAATKNRKRYAGRSTPVVERLGPAPKAYWVYRRAIWETFRTEFPWLGRSDRQLLNLAVELRLAMDTSETFRVSHAAQMRLLLSSMGGTPVDRSKISSPDDGSTDPAHEFVN